ncbi:MAG: TraR/DksA C4-type zinc finger protein [Microthrixaceae bacterium]
MSVNNEVDLSRIRELLLAERAELEATLADCATSTATDRPDASDGFGETEHVAHAEQLELSSRVAAVADASLREVDAALARLESGDYGTCTSCGDPIAPDRLEALPSTAFCLSCRSAAGTTLR